MASEHDKSETLYANQTIDCIKELKWDNFELRRALLEKEAEE